MKVSLRAYLLIIPILGALIGIGGRLLSTNPELLQNTLQVLGMPVAFLASLATLFWAACRKPSPWSNPTCAACGVSLSRRAPDQCKQCPNCQAELQQLGSLKFATPAQHKRFRIWALSLVALPFVCGGIGLLLFSGNRPISYLSDTRLVEERLPGKIDEPWVWQELERRVDRDILEAGTADRAAKLLIEREKRRVGPTKPYHWLGSFLKKVIDGDKLSAEVKQELFDTIIGTPKLSMSTLNSPQSNLNPRISLDTWSKHNLRQLGRDIEMLVTGVRLDGEDIDPQRAARRNGWKQNDIHLPLLGPWPKGEHELEVDVALRQSLQNPQAGTTDFEAETRSFTLKSPLIIE